MWGGREARAESLQIPVLGSNGKITHPKEHLILLCPNQAKIVEFCLKPPCWDCNQHYGKCPGPTKQAEV